MSATLDAIDVQRGSTRTDADQEDPLQQFNDADSDASCLLKTLHTLVILAEDESASANTNLKALLVAIESSLQRLDRSFQTMSSAFYTSHA